MTGRRSFVAAVAAAGGAVAIPRPGFARREPRVEAHGSLFYGHPGGSTSLVRFIAHDTDAPGGRLRVYDRRRNLLGTAAMLPSGIGLYGELWLPAERTLDLSTELEAPGLGRRVRNTHRLTSGRRWQLHVAAVVDAVDVLRELEALPPLRRAVQAALFAHFGATGDPLARLDVSDHVAFLRSTEPALELDERYGIPSSPVVHLAPDRSLPPTIPLLLDSAGARFAVVERGDGAPFERWPFQGQWGGLLLAQPPGGTTAELGFWTSRDEMARRIERWLTESPRFQSPGYLMDAALILHLGATDRLERLSAAVEEWNGRYAYPHLTVGDAGALFSLVEQQHGPSMPSAHGQVFTHGTADSPDAAALVEARVRAVNARAEQVVEALTGVWPGEPAALATIAAHVDASVSGTMVFNPSPFPRTDLVRMADGSERVVTDVPELGYAFFPDHPASPEWVEIDPGHEVAGGHYRVRLHPRSGAIASLTILPEGIDLVRPGSDGVNAVRETGLESTQRFRLERIASKVEAIRRGVGFTVRTSVTVYDHLPWVDIVNEHDGGARQYRFSFATDRPEVSWEIPAGRASASAPIDQLTHLRWIRLTAGEHGILFRGQDAPNASVDASGRLISPSPLARSRYRIGVERPLASPIAPWRFGWQTDLLFTAPVKARSGGDLPRFGSLLSIDRAGVAVVALKPADDGRGLILYLQELLGIERSVAVRPGLLRFGRVTAVDYFERERIQEPASLGNGVAIPVAAWGVTAVRLLDVQLARG